ncbi:MAG: site-specific integrase [Phycisphaerales bacterium]
MTTATKPTPRVRRKPAKPYPDFPLFPHATGRWAKKIRGRFAFFGPWEDPQAALARYLAQRDELYAGRVPRANGSTAAPQAGPSALAAANGTAATTLTLRDLVNHFLTAKQRRLTAAEMGRRSFADYHAACRRLVETFGVHRLVDDLTSADFGVLRSRIAETRGPVALGNEIGRIRSVFKYGYEAGLIPRPVRFGPEFVKPSKRTMRLARHAKGLRMFEAGEVRALTEAATPALKAMILLGINCGMGNTDVAELPRAAIDLKKGTLDFPRPKTGITRRAMLWVETVQAIKAALAVRPQPEDPADADLVFITKHGHRWMRVSGPGPRSKGKSQAVTSDAVGLQFGKLLRETGLQRQGRAFYSLRHTFRTVADELGDRRAVDRVMGHESGADVSTNYVERITDERLQDVSRHVRAWIRRPEARSRVPVGRVRREG